MYAYTPILPYEKPAESIKNIPEITTVHIEYVQTLSCYKEVPVR